MVFVRPNLLTMITCCHSSCSMARRMPALDFILVCSMNFMREMVASCLRHPKVSRMITCRIREPRDVTSILASASIRQFGIIVNPNLVGSRFFSSVSWLSLSTEVGLNCYFPGSLTLGNCSGVWVRLIRSSFRNLSSEPALILIAFSSPLLTRYRTCLILYPVISEASLVFNSLSMWVLLWEYVNIKEGLVKD